MVHFAFLACNILTLNTKKSSFFQWFLCIFPKNGCFNKNWLSILCCSAPNDLKKKNQNIENRQNLLCATCAQWIIARYSKQQKRRGIKPRLYKLFSQ